MRVFAAPYGVAAQCPVFCNMPYADYLRFDDAAACFDVTPPSIFAFFAAHDYFHFA